MFEVEAQTDYYTKESRYELQGAHSSKVEWSYGQCDDRYKLYYHSTCIENDKTFLFSFCEACASFDGCYELKVNNEIIKHFERVA